MSESHAAGESSSREWALPRAMLQFAVFISFMIASIVVGSGRFDWTPGWVFISVYVAIGLVAVAYLWRTNPDVIIARSTIRFGDQTAGQNVIVTLLIILFLAIFPVAALDDGRYQWSHVPLWLELFGYVLVMTGTLATVWVFQVNKFAEPATRIQSDRNQEVIDSGPYAIVRHPLYAATFLLCLGIPLALGSYWALLPSALGYVAIVVRTVMEDRMLHDKLAGYKAYAARVRYRLLPGVW